MYQHIMVESGAKVFQKNNRLCIEKDVLHELPAEDIATVVLDNREIIITTYCLEQLSSRGTVVILCNGKHMPESVLLPYGANSRRLKTIRRQISQKKPHLKQLWRQVVQEKIRAAGFDPAKWSQRRVQRSTALVTRHEAQQLLQQMGDGQHRQWLAAETFEIAVLSPTAGLFNPPAADDRGFNLGIVGAVYFPLEQTAP